MNNGLRTEIENIQLFWSNLFKKTCIWKKLMEAWEVNMRPQQGEIKTTGNHIASSINDMYIFILK